MHSNKANHVCMAMIDILQLDVMVLKCTSVTQKILFYIYLK